MFQKARWTLRERRMLLLISNERRCCLKNNEDRRVNSDSKGSTTAIEHELSLCKTAHGIAIVVVYRDCKLLASARLFNSKLLVATWEKQLLSPLALAGIITKNT